MEGAEASQSRSILLEDTHAKGATAKLSPVHPLCHMFESTIPAVVRVGDAAAIALGRSGTVGSSLTRSASAKADRHGGGGRGDGRPPAQTNG